LKDADIAAVAITDHFVMDVDRIADLQRIAGEDITVFPGIELRSELGGDESIHYIGIFPDRLNVQTLKDIWDELKAKRELTPTRIADRGGIDAITCDLDETCKMIHSLGGIVTIHSGSKANSIENIANTEYFKMIQKKEIVANSVDIMELGKAADEKVHKEIIFKSIGFSLPLIICSDNHNINDYTLKAPCWIKADTTFQGLKQIIIEPEDRVFIGDEPDILKRVTNNRTKHIHSFAIHKKQEAILDEIWFSENPEIVFNPGLISIIGNKGSGKSSIADTLGLLGNTQQSSHFSFLNPTKFRDKKDNKAKHFQAILKWESGDSSEKNLNDDIEGSAVETIKCIPQNYLEKICTEQIEGSLFNDELKKVIFSHVSAAQKLNFNKLDDLIEFTTKEKSSSIDIAKNEISTLNKEIAALEIKLHVDYKTQVNNKLQIKKQERASHELGKPKEKTKPEIDPAKQKEIDVITADIYKKVGNIQTFEKDIQRIEKERRSDYNKYINSKKLLDKLDNFQKQYDLFKSECRVIAEVLSLNVDDIIKLEINREDIEKLSTDSWDSYTVKSDILKEDNKEGPFYKKQQLQKEIDALRDRLDQPNKEYQAFLKETAEWEIKLKAIDGDESTPDTIKYYEKQIKAIDSIPQQLKGVKEKRLSKIKDIFSQLCQLRNEYGTLYKPVKDFVDSQKFAKERFSMDFRVSILCAGFAERFFDFIAQNRKGSFYGADDGQKRLKDILDSSDFDSGSGLENFLLQIEENLAIDQRNESQGTTRHINDQLRQGIQIQDFYNYIYSLDYLKPKYILRWAGKDLSQLSPGERGTVLLIFYLFISRDDIPLVIDQPEENLDNETVYGVLVPCIKEAKKRRQIIIVTHNPNLAVVCDADQIIHCEMKKEEKNKITYTSGAIENPKINIALIDILEGTRPAFDNRDQKYYAERLNYVRSNN
jgi:ABC-type lipoprotein export system ATPase subunit